MPATPAPAASAPPAAAPRDRVFHDSLYRTQLPIGSWWEASLPPVAPRPRLEGTIKADVAIIGGGYTGLSAALHLARDHGRQPVVLEAGPIAWGASGRNGGFACLPATKLGLASLVAMFGEDETAAFLRHQVAGCALPRELAAAEGFDIEPQGDAHYHVAHRPGFEAEMADDARLLGRLGGIPARVLSAAEFARIGHGGTEQAGALAIPGSYGLHPLRLARGLADAAERHGAQLFADSRVERWERLGDGRQRLVTDSGVVEAQHVVLATNGWTPDRLHPVLGQRVMPAISNIVTTRPLTAQERAAAGWVTEAPVSNSRRLLFYYRILPDGRLLFGARGDTSGSPGAAAAMRHWMERRIGELWPPLAGIETTHFWRGLVAMSRSFRPSLGRLVDDPRVYYAFGYHANGVNTAPYAGRLIARAIASNSGEVACGAVLAGLPPRIPVPSLRRPALWLAYAWRQFADWRDDRAWRSAQARGRTP